MVVVMVMMVVMAVNDDHNLCLRSIGHCEGEEKNQSKQNFFHNQLWRVASGFAELH